MLFARRVQIIHPASARELSSARTRTSVSLTSIALLAAIAAAGMIGYFAWSIPHQNDTTEMNGGVPVTRTTNVAAPNPATGLVQPVERTSEPTTSVPPVDHSKGIPAGTTKNTTGNTTGTELTDDGPHPSGKR